MYRFWIKDGDRVVVSGACSTVKRVNLIFRAFYRSWSDSYLELEYELITDDDVMNVGLEELIG